MEVYTIGFTKRKAVGFFGALRRANIKRLLDVRLNNSSQLAGFTKKDDLPFFLKELCDAEYIHEPLLAPTQDLLDAYRKKNRPGKPSQIRMQFSDGDYVLDCGVTDIRLYRDDHVTPDTKRVERVAKRLKSATGLILSVGLTRPYASSPDFSPVHWLQVNNIHLQDDPIWQLG